jgi:hypothetical protein
MAVNPPSFNWGRFAAKPKKKKGKGAKGRGKLSGKPRSNAWRDYVGK